jgi:hypothetical protein
LPAWFSSFDPENGSAVFSNRASAARVVVPMSKHFPVQE